MKIQWTDATWNPVRGCSRVSEGCRNCYAERQAARFCGPGQPYEGLVTLGPKGPRWNGTVRLVPERLADPLRWTKRRMVFVNSMSDLFHESLSNQDIANVFAVMAHAPSHRFQVLTKRPKRMLEWFRAFDSDELAGDLGDLIGRGLVVPPGGWEQVTQSHTHQNGTYLGSESWWEATSAAHEPSWPLPNVWLGVSVEDQATADERIPLLLQCPAAVRWVSYEPALGPVKFVRWVCLHTEVINGNCVGCGAHEYDERQERGSYFAPGLDWIVVGGESGPGARPFDVQWARSTIEQCKAAGVACFVKQLGAKPFVLRHAEHKSNGPIYASSFPQRELVLGCGRKGDVIDSWPEDLRVREWPGV